VRTGSGVVGHSESVPRGQANGNILVVAAATLQAMERFVQFIVAGGLALVAGLWLRQIADPTSQAWLAGVALAVLGAVALAVGINSQIDY